MITPLILLTRPEISADIRAFLSDWQLFHAPLSRIQFLSEQQLPSIFQPECLPYNGIIVTSQAGARWLGQADLALDQRAWPCLAVGEKTGTCLRRNGYQVTHIFPTIADLLANLSGSDASQNHRCYLYPSGLHRSVEIASMALPANLQIDQVTVYENKQCIPNQAFDMFWQEIANRRAQSEKILAVCPQYSKRSLHLLQDQIQKKGWQDMAKYCSLVGLSANILEVAGKDSTASLAWREKISAKHPTDACIRDVLTDLYARDCSSLC